MIINSKETGNAVFHIAINTDGTLQPIINVPLLWSNTEMLLALMQTEHIGIDKVEHPNGNLYMMLFDKNHSKPYPSVMIWRYIQNGENRLIVDVQQEDMAAVKFAVDYYLK